MASHAKKKATTPHKKRRTSTTKTETRPNPQLAADVQASISKVQQGQQDAIDKLLNGFLAGDAEKAAAAGIRALPIADWAKQGTDGVAAGKAPGLGWDHWTAAGQSFLDGMAQQAAIGEHATLDAIEATITTSVATTVSAAGHAATSAGHAVAAVGTAAVQEVEKGLSFTMKIAGGLAVAAVALLLVLKKVEP